MRARLSRYMTEWYWKASNLGAFATIHRHQLHRHRLIRLLAIGPSITQTKVGAWFRTLLKKDAWDEPHGPVPVVIACFVLLMSFDNAALLSHQTKTEAIRAGCRRR
jgi:hypothetical protein